MTFSLHPAARMELNQAVDYYEECQAGLGNEFAQEVYAAIRRALQCPEGWGRFASRARRCLTARFPYALIYEVREHLGRVVAITHSRRRPGYWKGRLRDSDDAE